MGEALREKMRTQRRLRVASLLSLAVIVLVVLPALFGLRAASADPIFGSLDKLTVPSWAAQQVDDVGSGSRWCFLDCRLHERTAQSSQGFKETTAVYTAALQKAGWTSWKVADCPEVPIDKSQEAYSCWRRDEYTLDLAVGPSDCALDQVAASGMPSAGATAAPAKTCVGSSIDIKVFSAIADTRGQKDNTKPNQVGATPAPTISADPLLDDPTPKAS